MQSMICSSFVLTEAQRIQCQNREYGIDMVTTEVLLSILAYSSHEVSTVCATHGVTVLQRLGGYGLRPGVEDDRTAGPQCVGRREPSQLP